MIRKHIFWPSDVLYITGESNVGKSQFMQQMIVESMLPPEFNGKDVSVVFLETRTNVRPHRIFTLMQHQIRKATARMSEDDIVKACHKIINEKLKIYRVHDLEQFNLFTVVLEAILEVQKTSEPSIFVLDCPATFYWSSCATVEQSRRLKYIQRVCDMFLQVCRRFDCPFVTGCRLEKGLEMAEDRVHLEVNRRCPAKTIYKAEVKQGKSEKLLKYGINENGIYWIN